MSSAPLRQGLYLITNDEPWPLLYSKLASALAVGVACVQYRRKQVLPDVQVQEVVQLQQLCQQYHTPLLINDNVALAERFGCGVHLGQHDGSVLEARARLGAQAVIGRTCHDQLGLAQQAQADGASYVAFGALYPSASKPHARRVALHTIREACQGLDLPVCVIGGLSPDNSLVLHGVGVALYAVIDDVLGRPLAQVAAQVQRWQQVCRGS